MTAIDTVTKPSRLDELTNASVLDRTATLVELEASGKAGQIRVTMPETGEVLAASSRVPEVDAARALIAMGRSGPMVTVWANSDVVAMRFPDIAALAAKHDRGRRNGNSD